MTGGNEIRLALAAIGLAEKGYKYTSTIIKMYKGNKAEFKVLTSMTHDVLDLFSDNLLTGVWDLGRWDYEVKAEKDWERAPWHINGQLFVYYKDPKAVVDTWKASLLLTYRYNKPSLRMLPNALRPKHLKDFTAMYSVEIVRVGRSKRKFRAVSTLKHKRPKTDDHIYTGQVELELKNNILSGIFYNADKIREPKEKTARAHVSFQNRNRWSAFTMSS